MEEFIKQHPSMIEDLRIAGHMLEKKRPVLAESLLQYAEDLTEMSGSNLLVNIFSKL